MAIPTTYQANFDTLLAAARNGDLALVETQDKQTGKLVYTVAAISFNPNNVGEEYSIGPLAKMFDGNPYDELNPPNPDGGFHTDVLTNVSQIGE